MRTLSRLAATGVVAGLSLVAMDMAIDPVAQASRARPPAVAVDWVPPQWHPASGELQAIPSMEGEGPDAIRLRSATSFVADLDAGEVLHAHGADERRPVASLTKYVSALALSTETVDLDQVHCVDARFYPTRSGARSRFSTDECYLGWDLLGSALVASDNRAAYGLAVQSGLRYQDFIARMDQVSVDLRMSMSTWADPSGLEDENLSTARDMAKAALAVANHPVLSVAATAPSWELVPVVGRRSRHLRATNRLLRRSDLEVLSGKTGYTDTAGYCFTGIVRTEEGRTLAITLLGAPRSRDRWADLDRVLQEFGG